jgi:hypothetical protein
LLVRRIFLAFELGDAKAKPGKLTNHAKDRGSIAIVQKAQYTRWLSNQWPRTEPYENCWWLAACLTNNCDWTIEEKRLLADRLQMLRAQLPRKMISHLRDAVKLELAILLDRNNL